jgi:hypothetical protein
MMNILFGTIGPIFLVAILIGVALLGAPLDSVRRQQVKRALLPLALIGVGLGVVMGALLLVERAPASLGADLDEMLRGRYAYNLGILDMGLVAVWIALIGSMLYQLYALWRRPASLDQARSILLVMVTSMFLRGHDGNPALIAAHLAYFATLLLFAAIVGWMLWRRGHDGGAHA